MGTEHGGNGTMHKNGLLSDRVEAEPCERTRRRSRSSQAALTAALPSLRRWFAEHPPAFARNRSSGVPAPDTRAILPCERKRTGANARSREPVFVGVFVLLAFAGIFVLTLHWRGADLGNTGSAIGPEGGLSDQASQGFPDAAASNNGPGRKGPARHAQDDPTISPQNVLAVSGGSLSPEPLFPAPGETVSKVCPDGLLVESLGGTAKGWAGLRKVKFADLPQSVQRKYGYAPQRASEYEAEQARAVADLQARQRTAAIESALQGSEATRNLAQIAADYHRRHTYLSDDIFVCADMACDFWDEVRTLGIPAKIMIGNIERDISAVRDCNHAWVMAEPSRGIWIAVDPTSGNIVLPSQNSRYYCGYRLAGPKQLKEYQSLSRQWNIAVSKHKDAADDYQALAGQRKGAGTDFQTSAELQARDAVLKQRVADLRELQARMEGLLPEKES